MPEHRLENPIAFDGDVVEWRGPAPFHFVRLPAELAGELRAAAGRASYGWGCLPASAAIGGVEFTTSLIPKDGGYILPLKAAVRLAVGATPGDRVRAAVRVARSGRG